MKIVILSFMKVKVRRRGFMQEDKEKIAQAEEKKEQFIKLGLKI